MSADGWSSAVKILARWMVRPESLGVLMEGEDREGISSYAHRRRQSLIYGAMREKFFLESLYRPYLRGPTRPLLQALLWVATCEILDNSNRSDQAAKAPAVLVHHAVAQARILASEAEARLVNAVLRKVVQSLPKGVGADDGEILRRARCNHPEWLVKRWERQHGVEAVERLLLWNQQPAPIYLVCLEADATALAANTPGLVGTRWRDTWELADASAWAQLAGALAEGLVFIQDPFARIPADLLSPKPGETVLDLCAAPGGKSRLLAWALAGSDESLLVSVDLPGARLPALQESTRRTHRWRLRHDVLGADILRLSASLFQEARLPVAYDGVLLDAPCSNTGVIRRRPDVRWRLREEEIRKLAGLQLRLLRQASRWVKPGGRLVYSTCSLEKEENEGVVEAFLAEAGATFVLRESHLSSPWADGHDGGGAFLFLRQ